MSMIGFVANCGSDDIEVIPADNSKQLTLGCVISYQNAGMIVSESFKLSIADFRRHHRSSLAFRAGVDITTQSGIVDFSQKLLAKIGSFDEFLAMYNMDEALN